MRNYFLTLFWLVSYACIGQDIFYSSITHLENNTYEVRIGLMNFLSCEYNVIYKDTTSLDSGYLEFGDLAIDPGGNLFGLGRDGIYLIDTVADSIQKMTNLPAHKRIAGITCSKDSILIFGEEDIYTYNLANNVTIHNGKVPHTLSVWSNIFWYHGKLMASANTKVVELDLNNPANSSVYCNLPPLVSGLLSFTEVAISCDSTATFALFVSGEVYLVDTMNCSLTFYCSLPQDGMTTYQGSEPAFMFMAPSPCQMTIDLDAWDKTAPGFDFKDTIYCDKEANLLGPDLDLFSDKAWDSLRIWIESPVPGIKLSLPNTGEAVIQGNQSDTLLLISQHNAVFSDLMTLLSQLSLIGDAPPGFSTIRVGFLGWAANVISNTAFADITIYTRQRQAGRDTSFVVCRDQAPFNFMKLLSGNADLGGNFGPFTSIPNVFTPGIDSAGLYYYSVTDPICRDDSSTLDVKYFPEPLSNWIKEYSICPGKSITLSIDNNYLDLQWPDGSHQPSYTVDTAQKVSVLFNDEYGCEFIDTLFVRWDDNCVLKQLFIPNVFSPDHNSINDFWVISPLPGITQVEALVFDRWGNEVYYNKGMTIAWDGLNKHGRPVQDGVYTYLVRILLEDGTQEERSGDITVIR